MKKLRSRPVGVRLLLPLIIILTIWLAADILLAALIGGQFRPDDLALTRTLANILSAVRFGLILIGALLVYPAMFFLGAPTPERVLASFIIPVAYMITAMIRSTAFFPLGQAIYYGLNQLASAGLFIQLGLIGLAEIGCRWWYRQRYHDPIKIVKWPYLAAILVGFSSLYVALFWEGGVHWFYIYQEGYKLLFQS